MWWVLGIYLLVGGGLTVAATRQVFQFQLSRWQAFRDTVELCGLRLVKISRPGARRLKLEARADPVAVRVEDIQDRKGKHGIRIVATFPEPPGSSGVRIRPETEKPPGAREFEAGDETFDNAFYVEGPARLLSARLDAETRRLLASIGAEGRLEVSGGEIRVETQDKSLANVLSLLLDLIRRLMQEVDDVQRLAENARHDPAAGVRLRNLLTLIREVPGEPTAEALRAACSDPSPQIRLRAAMVLGTDVHDILLEVAESLEDDDSSAQAVARLGRDLPFERARAILASTLRRRHIETARACLKALGKSGEAAAVDTLAKVLAVEKGELAAAAALALGTTGSPAAEPPLLQALRREKMDIRVAAAEALGRAGSAAAVLPLKEAAESAPRDAELRRAARQAVAEIQSRLQGATPGQLSLAGTEAGQLTLAVDPAGQLALTQHEPLPGERKEPAVRPV